MILDSMVKLSPLFTRENEERTEILRAPAYTSTPYPFRAESTYTPPETDAATQTPKPIEETSPRCATVWGSIALRFGGFSSQLKSTVEPLAHVRQPRVARNFFINRFAKAAEISARNPEAAHRIIAAKTRGAEPLWRNLLLVGCGDGSALAPALSAIEEMQHADEISLADCVARVAGTRPEEGRYLVRHTVKHVGTEAQLRMLAIIVDSRTPGSTKLVGELFESIMENSTATERRARIYPTISEIAHENVGRKSPSRGFLGALLNGWMLECAD